MVFEIDPDKPNVPALARILSGMGVLCLFGSAVFIMLAFASYDWINKSYAMAGSVGAFLIALVFAGQAKIFELLTVVSARVKSRFAIENLVKAASATLGGPASEKRPPPITQPIKERVIQVSDQQAREQGFKLR